MSQGGQILWDWVAKAASEGAALDHAQRNLEQDRYTVKEAARALGRHEKTVRGWMREGKLKYHRPTARTTYITRGQLASFLVRKEKNF